MSTSDHSHETTTSLKESAQSLAEAATPSQGTLEAGSVISNIAQLDSLPEATRVELEAAAFRTLVAHLQGRVDVQNIDLMNLAGFCRNCLSKWYRAAARERGVEIEDLVTRERVYGMPYPEWKAKHQK